MKARYYVRGIGIGMAVTAMILHFSVSAAERPMTDAEVMARARELGMVESLVLSRNDPTLAGENGNGANADSHDTAPAENIVSADAADPAAGSDVSEDQSDEAGSGVLEETDPAAASSVSEDPAANVADHSENDGNPGEEDVLHTDEETDETGEEQQEGMAGNENIPSGVSSHDGATITIVNGDSSDSVAGRLASMGLVSSKEEYDRYLCTHGYDRTIRTGVHVIPAGASYQQIAEIITSSAD